MTTRGTFHFFLMAALSLSLCCSAVAQEKGGEVSGRDAVTAGGSETGKKDPDRKGDAAGRENMDAGDEKSKADAAKKEKAKKAEARKKEARKKAEAKKETKKKEEPVKEEKRAEETKREDAGVDNADKESGDRLLLIDHEKIKYSRIPDITIKAEEEAPAETIVKTPDTALSGKSKGKKSEDESLFARKRGAIAGWGIVIFIFIVFVIYSKTRGKKSRRRVVRTVPKR